MDTEKRMRHENFVSNLNGGSIQELIGILFIPLALGYSRVILEHSSPLRNFHLKGLCFDLAYAFASFILPITLLSEYILETVIFTGSTACLLFWGTRRSVNFSQPSWEEPFRVWRRCLRTYILIYTCICIYAVDFPIFPRRFAKTEAYGVSLMDTGVGLISVSTGISNVNFMLSCREETSAKFRVVLRHSFPLIVLASARIIIVKLIGYPEHVSEYGIHWNFFFTMAFLRFVGFFIGYLFRRSSELNTLNGVFVLSVISSLGHQLLLNSGLEALLTLNSTMLTPESRQSSLILANAEGLVSLPGYLSLYLWGLFLGLLVSTHMGSSSTKYRWLSSQGAEKWNGHSGKLSFFISLMAFAFLAVSLYFGEDNTSRRFVNLPFISLQVFIAYIIAAFTLFCIFTDGTARKPIKKDLMSLIAIIIDNTLVYFLLSNLITGMLNLLIDTLELGDLQPAWLSTLLQLGLLTIYGLGTPLISAHLQLRLSSLF